ncbi:cyclin-T isoform X1 [Pieris napi]|uniref:cyclin-T isoform X1 n=1 Tax=Pieris napi TaxID=78633 RepID=UPI001FB9C6E7|nr:cyclin-T isoform X1 [Pieris napi]
MAGAQEKWYFSKEQLQNSASRKCGLDGDKELAYRQQAANLIQDMGQRLQVSQLCINTAIVYMHRFYAFHSFTQFHRNAIAAAALFLAAKVEEQPRKLEYVIKVAHVCLHRGEGVNTLTSSEQYQEQAQDLVFNENVLLQTLGFDVAIDHPHTHVVRTCHLVKAPKDLAQTSYFMASNSLHLTTMCLQYKPTVVACFCIHLASKWSNWQIPQSHEGRHWFSYVDKTVTADLLERLTSEFLHIFDKCPSRLKKKMMTMSNAMIQLTDPHVVRRLASGSSPNPPHLNVASPFDRKKEHMLGTATTDEIDKCFDKEYERERRRQQVPGGYVPAPSQPQPQKIDFNLYREKKEREERERRQQALRAGPRPTNQPPQSHRPPSKPHMWPHKPPHHKPPHDKPPLDKLLHDKLLHDKPLHDKPLHDKPLYDKPPHERHRPPNPPNLLNLPPILPIPNPPLSEIPQRMRPPSLFSPENVTPPATAAQPKRPLHVVPKPNRPFEKPPSPKKRPDTAFAIREMQPPAILSPISPKKTEPELVPVVKKLEERKKPEKEKLEVRNGIETDPTLVSNLLKESLAKPAPITVPTETLEKEKHKKEKKKKEKHKSGKKHKKERKKSPQKSPEPALRITIPRSSSPGLKIKIPKERITIPPPGLKIKISKDVLENSRKRPNMEGGPPPKIPKEFKVAENGNGPAK